MKLLKCILIVVLSVPSIFATAQSNFDAELVLLTEVNNIYNGATGGETPFVNTQAGYGISVGGYLTKKTTSKLTYQLGLLYRFRRHNFNIQLFFPNRDVNSSFENYNLQQLVIPFNALVSVSSKGQFVFGVSADLLLNKIQNVRFDFQESAVSEEMSEYVHTPFSTSLGYRHQIADNITLNAIVNLSFSNIAMPYFIEDTKAQRALQIGINYKL